eukprot:9986-Heterococcus_DN1.PRE.1
MHSHTVYSHITIAAATLHGQAQSVQGQLLPVVKELIASAHHQPAAICKTRHAVQYMYDLARENIELKGSPLLTAARQCPDSQSSQGGALSTPAQLFVCLLAAAPW